MRGYYGYYPPYWARIGQATPKASEIFKMIQLRLPTQINAVIRPLANQFNEARRVERSDWDMHCFPRRWVIWYGQSADSGPGSAFKPIGVFQGYQRDSLQALLELAFQQPGRKSLAFFAIGFENDALPLAILD